LGGNRRVHDPIAIAQQDGTQRLHQVNVFVAIDIDDTAARGALGIDRIATKGELDGAFTISLCTTRDALLGARKEVK